MDRVLFRTLCLFAATLLVVWGFLKILSPFLVAISWALCIVAITHRPYVALARRWRRPRLAAATLVIGTALAIVLPVLVVLVLAAEEVGAIAATGGAGWLADLRHALPGLYDTAQEFLAHFGTDLESALGNVARSAPDYLLRPVARGAWSMLAHLGAASMGLVIMLATQYFVYLEGPRLRAFLRDLSPLSHTDSDRIVTTLRDTTAAAMLGGVAVALLQGFLGAIGFLIVGLGGAVLWGLAMAFLSLLPIGGTAIVWGPVVVYLFAVGDLGHAWFLLAWGLLMVGSVDNVVRPWLLRRAGATVHPMLLFFAILSGIGLFGMSGIVFGPLMIALLMTVAQIYREHVAGLMASRDDDEGGAGTPAALSPP